jgi:hypothetical protein
MFKNKDVMKILTIKLKYPYLKILIVLNPYLFSFKIICHMTRIKSRFVLKFTFYKI